MTLPIPTFANSLAKGMTPGYLPAVTNQETTRDLKELLGCCGLMSFHAAKAHHIIFG